MLKKTTIILLALLAIAALTAGTALIVHADNGRGPAGQGGTGTPGGSFKPPSDNFTGQMQFGKPPSDNFTGSVPPPPGKPSADNIADNFTGHRPPPLGGPTSDNRTDNITPRVPPPFMGPHSDNLTDNITRPLPPPPPQGNNSSDNLNDNALVKQLAALLNIDEQTLIDALKKLLK
jgi:hypothetical protein